MAKKKREKYQNDEKLTIIYSIYRQKLKKALISINYLAMSGNMVIFAHRSNRFLSDQSEVYETQVCLLL